MQERILARDEKILPVSERILTADEDTLTTQQRARTPDERSPSIGQGTFALDR